MAMLNREKARAECKRKFNEIGIYCGDKISRLIGYGEDHSDSYFLLRYLSPQGECIDVYCSMVAGWYSIKKMGKKGYHYTEINCGIPKANEYSEKIWEYNEC